jgi:hypothetical protein
MHTRRITLGLSAIGGGLLAAAFLPMSVANADTADVLGPSPTPDVFGFAPDSPETVLTVSGLPPFDQQVEGYQTFDYFTTPTGDTSPVDVGSFNADVSTLTTPFGFDNTEYLVTGQPADIMRDALQSAALPTNGSVYDIANFGNGFENVYSDVLPEPAKQFATDALSGIGTAETGTITDTFVTPFGSFDLTPLVDCFSTAVNPFDNFLTTVDPGSIGDLGSILGTFDFLAAM